MIIVEYKTGTTNSVPKQFQLIEVEGTCFAILLAEAYDWMQSNIYLDNFHTNGIFIK